MPIQWKPFNIPTPKRNLPFDDFDMGEGNGLMPFMPLKKNEPAIDIYQDKNNLYVEVSLNGVKPEDVKISIDDNILTVEGKMEEKVEQEEKDYFRKEIVTGSFKRVIKLPVSVKEDKAVAETISGILKITIPKLNKGTSKSKEIPIKIK